MNLLNIFEVIVRSSLIGSIILLMILIIKRIFKNKLNCTFHYYIWLILIVKLIIPFGPQTPINISNIYENFYMQSASNGNTQINSSKQFKNTALGNSISISTSQPSDENAINKHAFKNKVNIEKVLCFVWMFGVLLLTWILALGYKKLREIIRASTKNISSTHKKILYNCMKAMNIRTEVKLSYSQKISSPSLCGFIKPKILIPVSVAVNVCDEDFKYIIMHELIHLKNKDIFINWVIILLSIIYWFNPILLYGFHKMRQDCEFSCDGQVISYLNQGENLQYGNAIIKVLELVGSSNRVMGTTSMVMNNLELKRRIVMISKYKKINIKGILLGTVIAVIIGGLGIAMNTSKVSSDKNIVKATTLQSAATVITSKSTVNNASNGTVPHIKSLPNDSISQITQFSSDIVIYNSHPDEDYPSGIKVTDVGAFLSDKLVKEGLKSNFIKCDSPTEYNKSYQATRDLITKNVKEYSNTILLDIHRDVTGNTKSADTRKLLFALAKSNPHYEANKKFVDRLSENIKNSKIIKSEILFYKTGISYFNEDLSNNSVVIEIGNNMSSDNDIEACVNALVSALKNIEKVSSN